jgi:hypothetical protein
MTNKKWRINNIIGNEFQVGNHSEKDAIQFLPYHGMK